MGTPTAAMAVGAVRDAPDGGEAGRIAILDDFFPHPGSAFRFEEFRSYLDAIPEARVYTSGSALASVGISRPIEALIADHERQFPEHGGRVIAADLRAPPEADLYYATFLHVIAPALDAIEARGAPFAFTLYPGGTFALDDAASDAALRRLLGSPCFRAVIATQPITKTYLTDKGFCHADQIVDLHGGVLTRAALPPPVGKRWYGSDKPVLDIAFVANRYTATGADKGYDLFVDLAKRLATLAIDVRFHVVGPYDPSIVALGEAADRFTFYGLQLTPFFDGFYKTIDMIVSPNRPFVLGPGRFDGFPTGCAVEAGLREVAVLCTDELGLNIGYVDGEDLVIIPPDVDGIVRAVTALAQCPARMRSLGANMRARALALYGRERQMEPRIALLRRLAAEARRASRDQGADAGSR